MDDFTPGSTDLRKSTDGGASAGSTVNLSNDLGSSVPHYSCIW